MAEPKILTDPCTIVIFGASGDLTWRKLVPALHSLPATGSSTQHRDRWGGAHASR